MSQVKKGKMSQQQVDKLLTKLKGTLSYDDFKNVDMVVEAAIENVELKQKIFAGKTYVQVQPRLTQMFDDKKWSTGLVCSWKESMQLLQSNFTSSQQPVVVSYLIRLGACTHLRHARILLCSNLHTPQHSLA